MTLPYTELTLPGAKVLERIELVPKDAGLFGAWQSINEATLKQRY